MEELSPCHPHHKHPDHKWRRVLEKGSLVRARSRVRFLTGNLILLNVEAQLQEQMLRSAFAADKLDIGQQTAPILQQDRALHLQPLLHQRRKPKRTVPWWSVAWRRNDPMRYQCLVKLASMAFKMEEPLQLYVNTKFSWKPSTIWRPEVSLWGASSLPRPTSCLDLAAMQTAKQTGQSDFQST